MASPAVEAPPESMDDAWTYTAFGVGFRADFPMPGLQSTSIDETARCTQVSLLDAARSAPQPPATVAELIFESHFGDDYSTLSICDDGSFHWSSSVYGDFGVSSDGRWITCVVDDDAPWRWRRFLIGQVLPLAALLGGFETIHASAVEIDGGAVVVTGPSHVGKTSIAAHLVGTGGTLVADDVVALENRGSEVLAHPALGLIGIRHEECARIGPDGVERLGKVVTSNDKEVLVGVARAQRPLPVQSVYLPMRGASATGEIRFTSSDDPRVLLGSTYNNVLRDPLRLTKMLDVYAAVSRTARVRHVVVPGDVPAGELAEAIRADHRAAR